MPYWKNSTEKSAQRLLTIPVDNGAPSGTNAIRNDSTEVNIVTRHSCISAKAEKNNFHNLWLYVCTVVFKEST